MEFVRFIFSSFWIFFGSLILIALICDAIVYIFRAMFRTPVIEPNDEQIKKIAEIVFEKLKNEKNK